MLILHNHEDHFNDSMVVAYLINNSENVGYLIDFDGIKVSQMGFANSYATVTDCKILVANIAFFKALYNTCHDVVRVARVLAE
jgi:hypothetical protein